VLGGSRQSRDELRALLGRGHAHRRLRRAAVSLDADVESVTLPSDVAELRAACSLLTYFSTSTARLPPGT
jgi:hypothetical protein